MSGYASTDVGEPETEDSRKSQGIPENLARNLVARAGFPHAKALRVWKARIAYTKHAWKKNEEDFAEALAWYEGENSSESGEVDIPSVGTKKDAKFSGATWFADANKLISFFNGRDPLYACESAKGEEFKPTAKATEKLGARIAREMDFRSRNSLAIFEAICRNHGFLRQSWDPYRWLPGWEYCDGEVRFDPDSNGDLKRAKYVIEEYECPLDDLLNDPEITEAMKKELRSKRECQRPTRTERGHGAKTDTGQEWDGVPGFERVTCYRIVSRCGVLPSSALQPDGDSIDDRPSDVSQGREIFGGTPGMPQDDEDLARHSPHMSLASPPEVPDDAPPMAPRFDPLEHGQRVMLLMVEGYSKILKVVPWWMDHYDRDELPYIEFKPTRPPGKLHGVSVFRAIRGYLKIINRAIEYWINIERHGGRRIIEYDKNLAPDEVRKIEEGALYEAVPSENVGSTFRLTEFAPRVTSFKELIPFLQKQHDDNSGINDAVSGQSPEVQETATGAQQRMDQAIAALGYIEAEVQRFTEEQARLTVAAAQRYIPRESTFDPCPHCSTDDDGLPLQSEDGADLERGLGMVAAPVGMAPPADMLGLSPSPDSVPCPECGGNGWDPEAFQARKRLIKGADFWLAKEDAAAWIDHLPLEEIRAEVIVTVRLGSTQRNFREREVAQLRNAGQDLVPLYQAVGGPVGLKKWNEYASAVAEATGIPDPERLTFSDQDLQAMAQMQAQQAQATQAAKAPPPGPPPEQIAAQQAAEQDRAAFERQKSGDEMNLKAADFQHRREMDQRKLALEERRQQLEEMPHMEALKTFRGEIAARDQQRAAEGAQGAVVMAKMLETVSGLAQVVQGMQVGMTAISGAATQLTQAAQAMQMAALAPKKVVRDENGAVQGVVVATETSA